MCAYAPLNTSIEKFPIRMSIRCHSQLRATKTQFAIIYKYLTPLSHGYLNVYISSHFHILKRIKNILFMSIPIHSNCSNQPHGTNKYTYVNTLDNSRSDHADTISLQMVGKCLKGRGFNKETESLHRKMFHWLKVPPRKATTCFFFGPSAFG